ncbi:hypothetical protein L9F63_003556, partial [Diploptera punctata]
HTLCGRRTSPAQYILHVAEERVLRSTYSVWQNESCAVHTPCGRRTSPAQYILRVAEERVLRSTYSVWQKNESCAVHTPCGRRTSPAQYILRVAVAKKHSVVEERVLRKRVLRSTYSMWQKNESCAVHTPCG